SFEAVHDSARLGAHGLPGIGFTTASLLAENRMKGVMTPGVSAGSNQVGARDTCTAIVIWPSGAAGAGAGTASATARARRATEASERRRTFTGSSDLSIERSSCFQGRDQRVRRQHTLSANDRIIRAHEHFRDSPRRPRRPR